MKKIILLFLIIMPLKLYAEWIYVGISGGALGLGQGDKAYIWKFYSKIENDGISFKLLTSYNTPFKNDYSQYEHSGVQTLDVFCNRPHRVMIGDIEGFSGKMGTGSLGSEKVGLWITVPDDSIYKEAINMICE